MPLLDHFHPPLSMERPWEGFHGSWASKIADRLNLDQLPPDYFAMPLITVGGRVEVDIATFQSEGLTQSGNGAVAMAVYAPPAPALTVSVDFPTQDIYEVQILQKMGGPKLRAVIELVSPANKDRPSNRRAFAIKCAGYLQGGISVVVVDVVTERSGNLHGELTKILQLPAEFKWQSSTGLYAVPYRLNRPKGQSHIQAWPEALSIGAALPTLPLWLDEEICLPLALEESYMINCASLRIAV